MFRIVAWATLAACLCPGQVPPARGGVLHTAQRAEPKTFNPVIAIDAPSREVLRRIHADLLRIDRGNPTLPIVPGLAESWKRSKDGRTFELKLRAGLRFSDGHPFTSDDVVFSFAVYQDEKIASPQRDLLIIDGKPLQVRALDALRVEFQLPQPYAAGERIFDSIAMLPKHLLQSAFAAGTLRQTWNLATAPEQIAGLGPFRIRAYKPGESVLLERNPYYWRKDRPLLEGIEFRFLPDEETQLAHFAAGKLDLLHRVQPKAIEFLQSRQLPVIDAGPSLEYNFVVFNLAASAKPYSNPALRNALSAAVDRLAMAKLVYQGRATPIWTPVSPGNAAWYRKPLSSPNHAIAEAKQSLAKAGYGWNAQGKLLDPVSKQPVNFQLLVSASSAERIQMANLVAADWKELGVDAQVVTLEFRTMIERIMTSRQFDAAVMGLGGGDGDPNGEMNVWLSSGATHLWNPSQTKPATPWESEIDDVMRRQLTTLDATKRKALYHRALALIEREQPMIFLVSPHVIAAGSPRVGNLKPSRIDHYTLWNCDDLFLTSR